MLYDNNWYKNVQDCSFFRHIPACGLVRKITKRLCRRVEETYSLNGSLQSNKIFCRRTATRITVTRCFPHKPPQTSSSTNKTSDTFFRQTVLCGEDVFGRYFRYGISKIRSQKGQWGFSEKLYGGNVWSPITDINE